MKLIREIRSGDGKLVFRRWQLLRTPWFSIFVHGMYEPEGDLDKHCHDHPWSFFSVILWGGYFEVVHDTFRHWWRKRGIGSVGFMPAEGKFHRILELNGEKSYSLVFARPSSRVWGYWTQDGWIDNVTYRNRKHEGTLPIHKPTLSYLERLRARVQWDVKQLKLKDWGLS